MDFQLSTQKPREDLVVENVKEKKLLFDTTCSFFMFGP